MKETPVKALLKLSALAALGVLGACGDFAAEEDAGTLETAAFGLTKGQPGATLGDRDYCYDPANPCDIGEGACGYHAHCMTGLKCASKGDLYGLPGVKVCHPAHCLNQRLDEALGEVGVDCGGVCGSCPQPTTCYDGVLDGDEVGVDCGGSCAACELLGLEVNSPFSDVVYIEGTLAPRATGRVLSSSPDQRANRTVELLIDGVVIGQTTTESNGSWSFRLPQQQPGEYVLTVKAINGDEVSTTDRVYRIGHNSGTPDWGQLLMGRTSSSTAPRAVATLANDDVVVAGAFSVDLNFGAQTLSREAPATLAGFIAAYQPDGTPSWAIKLESTAQVNIRYIKATADGGMLVWGEYSGQFDVGAGAVQATGAQDGFLLKLDAQGQRVWGRTFPVTQGISVRQLAVDPSGDIILLANFTGTATVGPNEHKALGAQDFYVARYDANGNFIWSKGFGGPTSDTVNDVGIDGAGRIYLIGSFESGLNMSTVTLPGHGVSGTGVYSAFAARLNSFGVVDWARDIGGNTSDVGVRLAVWPNGQFAAGGYFQGDVDFGVGTFTTSTTDNVDMYLMSYDANGAPLWGRQIPAILADNFVQLSVNRIGQLVGVGLHHGTINFGLGAQTAANGGTISDSFMVTYSSQGQPLRQRFFTSSNSTTVRGLAHDSLNRAVITGDILGQSVDLGGGELTNTARRAGFVATFK